MPDKLTVANRALGMISVDPLASFDQSGKVGDLVRFYYPQTIQGIFEEFPHHFAERRVLLNELAAGSSDPFFAYAYAWPANIVAVRRLMRSTAEQPAEVISHQVASQEVGGKWVPVIYAQEPDLAAWVTTSDGVEARFTQAFVNYAAADLAIPLNTTLRTSPLDLRDLLAMKEEYRTKAEKQSMQAKTFRPMDEPSSFERSRV